MTEHTAELTAATGDVAAAVEAGRMTATPHQLEPGYVYAIATDAGVHEVDLTGDEYRDRPRRIRRSVHVDDIASFAAYWHKHAREVSEVYADRNDYRIVGIIDAPDAAAGEPDWCEHTVTLQLYYTDDWREWTRLDRRYVYQVEFAEHIETHLANIVEPSGATMLEVAQTLHMTRQTATAGARGELEIPAMFHIAVPVFSGDTEVEVTARLRYRLDDSRRLSLGYALDRPDQAAAGAFAVYVDQLAQQISHPVMFGRAR